MALGINLSNENGGGGGGKFLPIVKFDAKSGDFIAINREPQSDGTWEKNEVEISLPIKAVVDLANLQVGWVAFAPTYSAAMAPAGERMPSKPTPDHKQGVAVRMFFKEHGLREFTPTSKTVLRVIDQLHDQFLSNADANKGKMPVVEFSGTETVKITTPQGELRFKAPVCKIVAWVDAPPAFAEAPKAEAAPTPAKAAPKPSRQDDDEEF